MSVNSFTIRAELESRTDIDLKSIKFFFISFFCFSFKASNLDLPKLAA